MSRKIPSINLTDIAKAISPKAKHKIVGSRPGEKLHEQMISPEDSEHTYEYEDHFKILPSINGWCHDINRIKDGKKVDPGFSYTSDNNTSWMRPCDLKNWIKDNASSLGGHSA